MFNITTVNNFIDDERVVNQNLEDSQTLLDSDVCIINPENIFESWKDSRGIVRPNYNNIVSPESDFIRKKIEYARSEVYTLLENGKIVIIFLTPLKYIKFQYNSSRDYKNVSNYDFLPNELNGLHLDIKSGASTHKNTIKLNPNSSNAFSQYYHAFKNDLNYTAYFDFDGINDQNSFMLNKSNRTIAYSVNFKNGLIVYLPTIGKTENTKLFGVINQCVEKIFKKEEQSPPPKWIQNYDFSQEKIFNLDLENLSKQKQLIEKEIENIKSSKNQISKFKGLLYEQGGLLEKLVVESFQLLGFKAENRKLDDMEHDMIFESSEGRGIAEIEGRNKDAIHIEKLDQLNRAVDEDFHFTNDYPQGILIGNPYRFTDPKDRKNAFTEKVQIVANKKSFALLHTYEIYKAVKYVFDNPGDEEFKSECRKIILITEGSEIILVTD